MAHIRDLHLFYDNRARSKHKLKRLSKPLSISYELAPQASGVLELRREVSPRERIEW